MSKSETQMTANAQSAGVAEAAAADAAAAKEKCWICATNDANSGEHMMKQSDLRDVFGNGAAGVRR